MCKYLFLISRYSPNKWVGFLLILYRICLVCQDFPLPPPPPTSLDLPRLHSLDCMAGSPGFPVAAPAAYLPRLA